MLTQRVWSISLFALRLFLRQGVWWSIFVQNSTIPIAGRDSNSQKNNPENALEIDAFRTWRGRFIKPFRRCCFFLVFWFFGFYRAAETHMGDVRDQSAAFAEAPITPQSAPDLERKAHALVDITSTVHRRPVNDITMNSPLKETPQMGHLQQTLGLL